MEKPFTICFLYNTFSAILLLLPLFSSISAQTAANKICQTKECFDSAENFKESMNFDINPCDDFYKYACGNWSKSRNNSRYYQDTISLRRDENYKQILEFLKKNNSNDEPEAVHKARKLFSVCLNKDAYKKNAEELIKNILQKIDLVNISSSKFDIMRNYDSYDYITALAKTTRLIGIDMYFDLGVHQNPFNRTVNMITVNIPSSNSGPLTKSLVELDLSSRKSIALAKATMEDVMKNITEVMRNITDDDSTSSPSKSPGNFPPGESFETLILKVAKAQEIIDKQRTTFNSSSLPVIYTLKQLQDLTNNIAAEMNATLPTFNWTRYIEAMFTGLDNVTLDLSDPNKVQIVIGDLDFVKEMMQFIHELPNAIQIAIGLVWRVGITFSEIISAAPTERTCVEVTSAIFGQAVGYLYTTKEKYMKAKIEIRKMFEYIRDSYKQIIQQASWMDEKTRQRALQKLRSLKSYIVYPSIINTTPKLNELYRDVQVTDDFYDTIISRVQNVITNNLNSLNKMNNVTEDNDWRISPDLVNAFYDPSRNAIIISAGLLGGSRYDSSLQALAYGGMGHTIAHEISHGFDNSGRRYNEIGNLENWWQPETLNLYKEKAKCFVRAYSNYSSVDSSLSLGDDIADNVGFELAVLAYRKYMDEHGSEPFLTQFENFTHEQLLVLEYANSWCQTPETVLSWDPPSAHSPNKVRTNEVLRNSEKFADIWKCPKGSHMNPSEKCMLW